MRDCPEEWFDPSWRAGEIPAAVALPDPTPGNLRVTLAHYQLTNVEA